MSAICLTTISYLVLALTPVQRWEAARRFDNAFSFQQFFAVIGTALVVLSAAWYVFIKIKGRSGGQTKDTGDFTEKALQRGLSNRETQILLYVAKMAGLKHHGAIFTMKKAFDLGATTMIREVPSATGMSAERIEQLAADLTCLREKLGFQQSAGGGAASEESASACLKPTSRKIPAGKQLYITRRTGRGGSELEATVIENSDAGITVRLPMEVTSPAGEQWRARYFYGASVWEFDVNVVKSDADTLVFGHSEQLRFINRRRFHRVAVNKKGYVASFPFDKELCSRRPAAFGGDESSSGDEDSFEPDDLLPQFVPAVVTELAGPGLRIETSLELTLAERVAVVFDLESQERYEKDTKQNQDLVKRRIVQGIGEVRHVGPAGKGFSAAVELTGLSDADINELIRATNAASVEAGRRQERQAEKTDSGQPAAADNVEQPAVEVAT